MNLLSFLTENGTGRDRGCDVTDRSSSFRTFPIVHNRDFDINDVESTSLMSKYIVDPRFLYS